MTSSRLQLVALPGIPLVKPGDDLAGLVLGELPTWLQMAGAAVASAGIWLLVTRGSQPQVEGAR